MERIINKSIKQIMNFSKEEREEYEDILPEDFYKSMQMFESFEKKSEWHNIRLTSYSPAIAWHEINWVIMPKNENDHGFVNKRLFEEIFKLNPYKNHKKVTTSQILFLKGVIAFLFDIDEEQFALTLETKYYKTFTQHTEFVLERVKTTSK